jgi:hypothetical protein
MEDLYLRRRTRGSFVAVTAFTAVTATLGVIAVHLLIGWILLVFTAFMIVGGWPYMIYATGYQLRADGSGLYLLRRGRQRRAFRGTRSPAWPGCSASAARACPSSSSYAPTAAIPGCRCRCTRRPDRRRPTRLLTIGGAPCPVFPSWTTAHQRRCRRAARAIWFYHRSSYGDLSCVFVGPVAAGRRP